MDSLDVLRVGAKVGHMVDFVFPKLCELISEIRSQAWKRVENIRYR